MWLIIHWCELHLRSNIISINKWNVNRAQGRKLLLRDSISLYKWGQLYFFDNITQNLRDRITCSCFHQCILGNRVGGYLADQLSGFLRLLDIQRLWGLPADALHPAQIGPVLFLNKDPRSFHFYSPVVHFFSITQVFIWMSNHKTNLALESIGLLCPGDVHVRRQSRILVEESPVVGLGCQVLSLLCMADVQHIQIHAAWIESLNDTRFEASSCGFKLRRRSLVIGVIPTFKKKAYLLLAQQILNVSENVKALVTVWKESKWKRSNADVLDNNAEITNIFMFKKKLQYLPLKWPWMLNKNPICFFKKTTFFMHFRPP